MNDKSTDFHGLGGKRSKLAMEEGTRPCRTRRACSSCSSSEGSSKGIGVISPTARRLQLNSFPRAPVNQLRIAFHKRRKRRTVEKSIKTNPFYGMRTTYMQLRHLRNIKRRNMILRKHIENGAKRLTHY